MSQPEQSFLTLTDIKQIAKQHNIDPLRLAGMVDAWQNIISGEGGNWSTEKIQQKRQQLERYGVDVNRIKPTD